MTDEEGAAVDGVVVRVYCTADDRSGHRALVMAVTDALAEARALEVGVLRSTKGYGRSRRLHDVDAVDSGMNHPVVVEWVDTRTGFERCWPRLRPVVADTLVTLEHVAVTAVPPPSGAGRAPRPGGEPGG